MMEIREHIIRQPGRFPNVQFSTPGPRGWLMTIGSLSRRAELRRQHIEWYGLGSEDS